MSEKLDNKTLDNQEQKTKAQQALVDMKQIELGLKKKYTKRLNPKTIIISNKAENLEHYK